jgi:inosose dehydratase
MDVVSGVAVGTASVNWGFDPLYTWVQTPHFGRMLDEMAQAGYAGTEISYNFPSNTQELRAALESRSLRAAATFHALDLRDEALLDEALRSVLVVADRLQALGADVLILSDRPSAARLAVAGRVAADGSDGLDDRAWRNLCGGLNRIGELLLNRAMRAVFHPHVGTYVETRSEIDRLCAATDPALVGLCPDTGHLAYAGVDPMDVFRDYAPRIGYVHLKDVNPAKLEVVRAKRTGFVEAVRMGLFVELGTGMVPIPRIVEALALASYQGWIIVEQDAPPDPLKAAIRNRRFLREACAV